MTANPWHAMDSKPQEPEQNTVDRQQIDALIRSLGSRRRVVRSEAYARLLEIGSAAVPAVTEALASWRVSRMVVLAISNMLLIWMVSAVCSVVWSIRYAGPVTAVVGPYCAAIIAFLLSQSSRTLPRRMRALLQLVAECDEPRCSGTMASAATWSTPVREREMILNRLAILLPHLTDTEYRELGSAGRESIRSLVVWTSADAHAEALTLLAKYGGRDDWEHLDQLRRNLRPRSNLRAVLAPAVAQIRARLDAIDGSTTLLRPTDGPAQADTLLRPAPAGTETPPELLVRPAELAPEAGQAVVEAAEARTGQRTGSL